MIQINRKFTQATLLAISGLFVVPSTVSGNAGAGELQLSRYQTLTLQPTGEQVDLLSNIVEMELPPEINTVGQAVSHLLEGSGYRLLSSKLAEPYRVLLFSLPLPEVQRQLGPISLRDALELLSGPAFRLVVEPVYRLVSFELVTLKNKSDADS